MLIGNEMIFFKYETRNFILWWFSLTTLPLTLIVFKTMYHATALLLLTCKTRLNEI